MSKGPEPWYPYKGDYKAQYKGDSPPYYDLKGKEWYEQLKRDMPAIKKELTELLKQDGIDIKQVNIPGRVAGTGWGGFMFQFWKIRNEPMIAKAPELFSYFNDIPGIVQLSVSILQPKTRINPHSGETDAIYRMHIPIYIPAQLPDCGIMVDGISRPWVENEVLAFCDAHYHEAWNMTDQPRIVIILDVMKEQFLSQTDEICTTVRATMAGQALAGKIKILGKILEWSPVWVRNVARAVLKILPF